MLKRVAFGQGSHAQGAVGAVACPVWSEDGSDREACLIGGRSAPNGDLGVDYLRFEWISMSSGERKRRMVNTRGTLNRVEHAAGTLGGGKRVYVLGGGTTLEPHVACSEIICGEYTHEGFSCKPGASSALVARHGAQACSVGTGAEEKILLFGGRDASGTLPSDVVLVQPEAGELTGVGAQLAAGAAKGEQLRISVLSCDGDEEAGGGEDGLSAPGGRWGHTLTCVGNERDKVILFGGRAQDGSALSDAWCLDVAGLVRKPKPKRPVGADGDEDAGAVDEEEEEESAMPRWTRITLEDEHAPLAGRHSHAAIEQFGEELALPVGFSQAASVAAAEEGDDTNADADGSDETKAGVDDAAEDSSWGLHSGRVLWILGGFGDQQAASTMLALPLPLALPVLPVEDPVAGGKGGEDGEAGAVDASNDGEGENQGSLPEHWRGLSWRSALARPVLASDDNKAHASGAILRWGAVAIGASRPVVPALDGGEGVCPACERTLLIGGRDATGAMPGTSVFLDCSKECLGNTDAARPIQWGAGPGTDITDIDATTLDAARRDREEEEERKRRAEAARGRQDRTFPGGEEYNGYLKGDQREGEGRCVFPNGDVYEGQWSKDTRCGQGTMTFSNGDVYTGAWDRNTPMGTGVWTYSTPETSEDQAVEYSGEFRDGVRHGTGSCRFADGSSYEGAWEHGMRTGRGTLTLADGTTFEGTWAENACVNARLEFPNGDVYDGPLRNGVPHGEGHMTYADRSEYSGEFRAGKRNGHGRLIYANNDVYEGKWRADEQTGRGVWKSFRGEQYSGDWVGGKPHGHGKFIHVNKDVYEGGFVFGSRCGKGTLQCANGTEYTGDWARGKREGFGEGVLYRPVPPEPEDEEVDTVAADTTVSQHSAPPEGVDGLTASSVDASVTSAGNVSTSPTRSKTPVTEHELYGKYRGGWGSDEFHGFGDMEYADGTIYSGEFRHGLRHGTGKLLAPGGSHAVTTEFVNDVPVDQS